MNIGLLTAGWYCSVRKEQIPCNVKNTFQCIVTGVHRIQHVSFCWGLHSKTNIAEIPVKPFTIDIRTTTHMGFTYVPKQNCMCILLFAHVHKKVVGYCLMTWRVTQNSLQEVLVTKRITVLYFFLNGQIIQVNMASVVQDKAVGCYVLIWIFLKLLLLTSVSGAPYGKFVLWVVEQFC